LPEQLSGKRVTPNFFDVWECSQLWAAPLRLKKINPRAQMALISYSLWQRRYGGEKVDHRSRHYSWMV